MSDAIAISSLGKTCSFWIGYRPTRTSKTCDQAATTVVMNPDASVGGFFPRCSEHAGMLDAGRQGETLTELPAPLADSIR